MVKRHNNSIIIVYIHFITLYCTNLQIATHGLRFEKHVSDYLHPSSVLNANRTTSRCDINTLCIYICILCLYFLSAFETGDGCRSSEHVFQT